MSEVVLLTKSVSTLYANNCRFSLVKTYLFFLHFSNYQVIVLKVADGAYELPGGYASKLKDSNNANKDNLPFYVAAEITNVPVHEESWEFTVGDKETYGTYINKGLEVGEVYFIYQRAVTNDNGVSTYTSRRSQSIQIGTDKNR